MNATTNDAMLEVLKDLVNWHQAREIAPSLCGSGHADYIKTIVANAEHAIKAATKQERA